MPRLTLILIFALCAACLQGQTLRMIAWNVEGDDADLETVGRVVAERQGIDLWGFSEVPSQAWFSRFLIEAAAGETGAKFEGVLGHTGGGDRLAIVYNSLKYELVEVEELSHINIGGNVRAPLVAHLRLRENGKEFKFVVNHLYRGNNQARHQQSTLLNAWAQQQLVPVITAGDFNYDWAVSNGDSNHDRGYDNLTADGVFVWVRPPKLVRTQCSSFDSVLDFFFVSGEAKQWKNTSEILFADDAAYCPDNNLRSDHRPLLATFTIAPVTPEIPAEAPTRAQLLKMIAELETKLGELKRLVEKLPNNN